ncbi:sensor histidine kinase VraS [Bacillus sp. JCM 19046]|nr:sensor histidine kinase VraS [Bacillus sp. JCM 19045]GAF18172.1 sensor histidine kinase VraS [Bacillus sp. JCM 19046]
MRWIGVIVFLLLSVSLLLFYGYLVNEEILEWSYLVSFEPGNYPIPLFVWFVAWFFLIAVIIYLTVVLTWKRGLKTFRSAVQKLSEGHLSSGKKEVEELSIDFKEATILVTEMEQRIRNQADRSQKVIDQWTEKENELKNELVFQERHRIARELHDSVSQQLYAASMLLSAAVNQKNSNVESLQKRCEQIEKVVNDAQNDMRALLLQLRPIQLENQSFKDGVEQLVQSLAEKHPISFSVRLSDTTLSPGVEDQLFRITQEAIANALRHANANEISVFYENLDHFTVLKITDDGTGFERTESMGGYGLNGIEERAEEIGGTMRIISVKGQGTSVEVKVPIVEGDELND